MTRMPPIAAFVLLALGTGSEARDLDICWMVNVAVTLPSYAGCADPDLVALDELDCVDVPIGASVGPGFVWVVINHLDGFENGIGGAQFGLSHDLGFVPWTLCTGGSEIPMDGWPASGTGNAVVWTDGCYEPPSETARVGFLSVAETSSGEIFVVGDPRIGDTIFADCNADLFSICHSSSGGGSLTDLYLACEPCGKSGYPCYDGTPAEATTWGRLRSVFGLPDGPR